MKDDTHDGVCLGESGEKKKSNMVSFSCKRHLKKRRDEKLKYLKLNYLKHSLQFILDYNGGFLQN